MKMPEPIVTADLNLQDEVQWYHEQAAHSRHWFYVQLAKVNNLLSESQFHEYMRDHWPNQVVAYGIWKSGNE